MSNYNNERLIELETQLAALREAAERVVETYSKTLDEHERAIYDLRAMLQERQP